MPCSSCGSNGQPGGNGKLTDQVCFVCQAFFGLMEWVKNHVQKIIDRTIGETEFLLGV